MNDQDGLAENLMEVHGRQALPHITVCICTYKRPTPLQRLLTEVLRQETNDLFTYSIVVVDNDAARSAETAVAELRLHAEVPVVYLVEPRRGISFARNRVLRNAEGEYVALIDDDEYPTPGWLITLFITCGRYKVNGVLGPVKRQFDEMPPKWLLKSRLYDRKVHETGEIVDWRAARTGNCLLERSMMNEDELPFNTDFTAGEDEDFFRRKIQEGFRFVWCGEAEVFEVIPPARWKRSYCAKKALLQGANAARHKQRRSVRFVKSIAAIPIYTVLLPFALLLGQHRFMELLVKLCDHAGQLMMSFGMNPIRDEYISD